MNDTSSRSHAVFTIFLTESAYDSVTGRVLSHCLIEHPKSLATCYLPLLQGLI